MSVSLTGSDPTNRLTVLFQDASGDFGSPVTFTFADGLAYVASGDFNNDSKADLAFVNRQQDYVGIVLGNGDGTFGAVNQYSCGGGPNYLALADFNNDGKLDLATRTLGNTNSVTVLNQHGFRHPCFQRPLHLTINPPTIAAGDLNRDGKMDLVVTSGNFSKRSRRCSWQRRRHFYN